jgi:hypothetical protein
LSTASADGVGQVTGSAATASAAQASTAAAHTRTWEIFWYEDTQSKTSNKQGTCCYFF